MTIVERKAVYESWKALRGETFRKKVKLYLDDANTIVPDLTKYTVRVFIGQPGKTLWTLTVAAGILEVTNTGDLTLTLNPTQTKEPVEDKQNFFIELEESATEKAVPMRGDITFAQP